jgi:translation initiation factor IF-1
MKKIIRLKESDLQNIVKRVLSEQTTGSTESSLGNSMSRVKLDSGVEIGEEYLEEYKKVKLEISGKTNEVLNSLRKLKYKGAVEVEPGITVEKKGTITFKGTEWVLPSDLDYTSL